MWTRFKTIVYFLTIKIFLKRLKCPRLRGPILGLKLIYDHQHEAKLYRNRTSQKPNHAYFWKVLRFRPLYFERAHFRFVFWLFFLNLRNSEPAKRGAIAPIAIPLYPPLVTWVACWQTMPTLSFVPNHEIWARKVFFTTPFHLLVTLMHLLVKNGILGSFDGYLWNTVASL